MNFYKCYYALVLILSFNAFGMQVDKQFTQQSETSEIMIRNDSDGLTIFNNKVDYFVKKHWIDSQIRNMSNEQLAIFLQQNYIVLRKMSDGECIAKACIRSLGGGVGGATAGFWLGKAAVHVVGHGAIAIVSSAVGVVSTPAGGAATAYALEGCLGPIIEAASNVVAVGTAVAAGTATGPV